MPKKRTFTKDMTIYEVLNKYPESSEILQQFGLYCVGCSLSAFETLEQGILGHGMPKKTLTEILKVLNTEFEKLQKEIQNKGVHLTNRAALKILELAKAENRKIYALRVKMEQQKGDITYAMDFANKPGKTDQTLEFPHKVKLFIDPKSLKNLKGSTIDYVVTYEAEGFRIDNPNE